MDLISWLIVGLVAGVAAALLVGSAGYGLVGDVVVGMIGAVVGGAIFRDLHWRAPLPGLPGVIAVALLGAVLLLVGLRVLKRYRTRVG